ncbi:NADPH-dependent F420 reductase [Xanthomonas campestris]|uniref:NADPH-dependent F420 reductase n=1 Tax=Xanthomonas campestris TaxID=339 RepID=UPI002366A2E2|nr:NAD(P)-binding domain-containing protein [Xanthomonas campestris]WDJ06584.1 NAD(P)-binding domain-containing protein [Xanthomonas campestris pv. incanae]
MRIGIIGTGNIGGTLARKLHAAQHDVRVANSRGEEGVRAFAQEIGVTPVDVREVVRDVDVIVLAIPLPAIAELAAGLCDAVPPQVPVIDTSNYYPGMRDARIAALDAGTPESAWVSGQIGRPVIKAFNNILADSLAKRGTPAGSAGRLAVAVAGDDAAAKQTVMQLVDQVGFDPVDGGALADSWRQQSGTPAYCCDDDAARMRAALAAAIPGVAPGKRDQLPQWFAKLGPNPSHAQIIAMNRALNTAD